MGKKSQRGISIILSDIHLEQGHDCNLKSDDEHNYIGTDHWSWHSYRTIFSYGHVCGEIKCVDKTTDNECILMHVHFHPMTEHEMDTKKSGVSFMYDGVEEEDAKRTKYSLDVYLPEKQFNEFWDIVYTQKPLEQVRLSVFFEMAKEPTMIPRIDGGEGVWIYYVKVKERAPVYPINLKFKFAKIFPNNPW